MSPSRQSRSPLELQSCEDCGISALCASPGLLGGDLQSLRPVVSRRFAVARRGLLYRAGDSQTAIHIVRSGCVKTSQYGIDGEEQVLDFYLPGEVIGLEDLSRGHHHASAIALERTWICSVPTVWFLSGQVEDSRLLLEMLRVVAGQLTKQHRIIELMRKANVSARLSAFLLDLSRRLERRRLSGTRFRLSMDRADIANHLRSTLESVSRSFSQLSSEGLIKVSGKAVEILDANGLRERVDPRQIRSGT